LKKAKKIFFRIKKTLTLQSLNKRVKIEIEGIEKSFRDKKKFIERIDINQERASSRTNVFDC